MFYCSMSPVGKTNEEGYALLHDIVPYINYDISFDANQLPIESKVPNAAYRLVALGSVATRLISKCSIRNRYW